MIFDVTMTMPILTRLLTTRIVANSESDSDSSFRIVSEATVPRCFRSRISAGVSEKNATSDAETAAETTSSTTVTIISPMTYGGQPRYVTKSGIFG